MPGLVLSAVPVGAAQVPDEEVIVHPGNQAMSASREVSYRDLDLSKPDDIAVLEARTNRAAVQVCTELNDRNPWSMRSLFGNHAACVTNARQQALADVPGIAVSSGYRFASEGD